jgi:hypothetical protein
MSSSFHSSQMPNPATDRPMRNPNATSQQRMHLGTMRLIASSAIRTTLSASQRAKLHTARQTMQADHRAETLRRTRDKRQACSWPTRCRSAGSVVANINPVRRIVARIARERARERSRDEYFPLSAKLRCSCARARVQTLALGQPRDLRCAPGAVVPKRSASRETLRKRWATNDSPRIQLRGIPTQRALETHLTP